MAQTQTLSTHGYFDPTDATFRIITPKNVITREVPIPDDILAAPRNKQETWVRTQIRKTGAKPVGRANEYPYGFFYVVA